jgi:chemotaxis response regulator CheB
MPMEAIKCGGAEQVLPLQSIAAAMITLAQERKRARPQTVSA